MPDVTALLESRQEIVSKLINLNLNYSLATEKKQILLTELNKIDSLLEKIC